MKKFTVKPRFSSRKVAYLGTSEDRETDWLYLGRLAEVGGLMDVRYDTALPHVIAIFGKRGSGKSYTMGSILESLCTQEDETSIGLVQHNTAVFLLDTLGIFQWTDIRLDETSNSEVIKKQLATWRGWNLKPENLNVEIWIPKRTRVWIKLLPSIKNLRFARPILVLMIGGIYLNLDILSRSYGSVTQ